MNIHDVSSLFGLTAQATGGDVNIATRTGVDGQTGAPAAASRGDTTRVSSAGGALVQATDGDDVRSAKVAALQSAIAAGTYSVASTAVADKLINTLLGRG